MPVIQRVPAIRRSPRQTWPGVAALKLVACGIIARRMPGAVAAVVSPLARLRPAASSHAMSLATPRCRTSRQPTVTPAP